MTRATNFRTLAALSSARQLVEFLSDRIEFLPEPEIRVVTSHVGAALADSILQAGLRYDTVVAGRVRRIIELFPEAATVSGTIDVLSVHGAQHFLWWKHPHRIVRFTGLLCHIHAEALETRADLHAWLDREEARQSLLMLTGIGPKTVDYLCGLIGLDCVAVDRHMRQLSLVAGIEQTDYSELKLVVSYAADLMNLPRRDFDWWIWRVMSQKNKEQRESPSWLQYAESSFQR